MSRSIVGIGGSVGRGRVWGSVDRRGGESVDRSIVWIVGAVGRGRLGSVGLHQSKLEAITRRCLTQTTPSLTSNLEMQPAQRLGKILETKGLVKL